MSSRQQQSEAISRGCTTSQQYTMIPVLGMVGGPEYRDQGNTIFLPEHKCVVETIGDVCHKYWESKGNRL